MEYRLYKLKFTAGVHFGKGSLTDGEIAIHADTLFSALCLEALKLGGKELLEELVALTRQGELLFSDLFPMIGKCCYLPRPFLYIEPREGKGDSSLKKQYKKMSHVPADGLEDYLKGCFPVGRMEELKQLGTFFMKTSAAISGREETEPYRVKSFHFQENSGLCFILGSVSKAARSLAEELLESLSYSGLGGKRSAGYGRFQLLTAKMPEELERRLTDEKVSVYMLLSAALPRDGELDAALSHASYQLIKRSGFVESDTYAPEYRRKKDLYLLNAGSCFERKFEGDVYDVSSGGSHPVYRYAKPLFLGVST